MPTRASARSSSPTRARCPVVLYQIPVVSRATETVDAAPDHIIGSPEPGTTFIDGPFDPAYARALIRLVTRGGEGRGPRTVATGHPTRHVPPDEPRTASVMTGEQSNTSLIYRSTGMPIICKVYRQLHPGLNPDIELPSGARRRRIAARAALDRLGRRRVAGPRHRPGHRDGLAGRRTGVPAGRRGRVARGAARRGPRRGLPRRAHAPRHRRPPMCTCRSPSSSRPGRAQAADRADTAATWRRRLAIAIAEVPAIAERRDAIEAVYDQALEIEWPRLQRIHGDYHLGQVLQVPDEGWVLLDFEGEPLRPMAERTRADLALRDVAGMLRSFDYVSGSIRLDDPDRSPRDGARVGAQRAPGVHRGVRAATRARISARSSPLLAALELDKAVYEAIYEARNRPTWVSIPLRAIARLVERPAPRLLTRDRLRRRRRRARPRRSRRPRPPSVASARAYQASHSAMSVPTAAWKRSVAAPGVVSPK